MSFTVTCENCGSEFEAKKHEPVPKCKDCRVREIRKQRHSLIKTAQEPEQTDESTVKCIRCDVEIDEDAFPDSYRTLTYFQGTHAVAICMDCYKIAQERRLY
jgi:DNA-directed RNA polymerase subunit RPC12/RpoP